MQKYVFRLESLLNLRRTQRDQVRQILAEALRREQELLAQRQRVETERHRQLQELKQLVEQGHLNVDGAAARRFYAGQLVAEVAQLEQARLQSAGHVALCRQALVQADQAVKSLERLSERQRAEYMHEAERRAQIELEEAWRAAQAGNVTPC